MSSKRTLVKYCRIFMYVESLDPDFAQVIKNTCLEGSLSPGRGSGVTFLIPEQKVRDKIVNDAYTDKIDDVIKQIKSYIIPDYFKDGTDFQSKACGNLLGSKFEVVKASKDSVEFSDFKIKKTSFMPTDGKNLAVYEVTSGVPPMTEGTYRSFSERPKKTGGAESASRRSIANRAKQQWLTNVSGDPNCTSPYLEQVTTLVKYIQKKHPNVYEYIYPLLRYDPIVTYYILIEPSGTDTYVIPDVIINEWNGSIYPMNFVQEYIGLLSTVPAGSSAALANRVQLLQTVQTAKNNINSLQQSGGTASVICKKIEEAYQTYYTSGNYPQELLNVCSWQKKMTQDYYEYCIQNIVWEFLSISMFGKDDIVTMSQSVTALSDHALQAKIDIYKDTVLSDAGMQNAILYQFANSSCFLYAAPTPSAIGPAFAVPDRVSQSVNYSQFEYARLQQAHTHYNEPVFSALS